MQNIAIVTGVIVLIGVGVFFFLSEEPVPATTPAPVAEMPIPDVMEMDTVDSEPVAVTPPDVVGAALAAPNLSTLVTAVSAAGLVETLQGPGPFTVFAPTDEAFAALPAGTVETLLEPENLADLQGVLTYHVVPGMVTAADLTEGMELTTVQGETLTVSLAGGATINGAAVVTADVLVSNGVVHIIDAVLLPSAE